MDSLGTRLHFSTAYHPQTDGQSERTIQTLEDLLRACVLDFGGSWEDHLHLVEFSYNNSYQASIDMSPFEMLYGRRCRSALCWEDVGDKSLLGPELVQQSAEKVKLIRERIRVAQDRQKAYADVRRRPLEFAAGDRVFLRVSPTRGVNRFGVKGKLKPRYVGPFRIAERIGDVSYRLDLPAYLAGVHDVFHVSQLRACVEDGSHLIDTTEIPQLALEPDLSFEEKPVEILDRKTKLLRNKEIRLVRVAWRHQSPGDSTWELEDEMRRRFPYLFSD